jgi:hypothetical protein
LANNNIVDIETDFPSVINPTYLDLSGNRIRSLDNAVFRKQVQLEMLILSGNMLQRLGPGLFSDCTNLRSLSLSGNNISQISWSAFHGLEHLEHLDLSNNNIEKLHPLIFQTTLTNANRQSHQVSKLKHLNLAQNKIRSFNFELYFPMSSNSDTSTPAFELEYLNISSNRLTTLDVTSVKWLNHTTAVADLTLNPWNCDCSVLIEMWRELKEKLTLRCASPRQLEGKSWDVVEIFCSKLTGNMNCTPSTSSEAVRLSTECKDESEVSTKGGSLSVITITLIVIGVLLGCVLGGGFILAIVVKRRRNKSKTPEYWDVYAPMGTQVSVQSYAVAGSDSTNATEYAYVTVQ